MIKLRSYQEQALAAEAQHRIDHPDETRLAIVCATGLGKGTMIAWRAVEHVRAESKRVYSDALMNRLPRDTSNAMIDNGTRVLILAPTDEIVTDLAARCRLLADGFQVGIVKAEQDDHSTDIVVASVQTLLDPARRARITDVGLVIVDECEAYVAPQWRKVLEWFGCFPACDCAFWDPELGGCTDCMNTGWTHEPVPALGFTATLERGDGASLGQVWQNVAFTRDISWGVRKGYLVQPIGYRLEIDLLDGKATFENTDRALDGQLIDAMAPEKIVEKWLEIAADRPTVAFMPLVRSAHALALAFIEAGISARVVHGGQSDSHRRDVLRAYESGEAKVIVNAMVLTRGWDSPRTKCVIVGRPTKSRPLFVQMAGRGLRPVPGIPVEEQDCILLCVSDATTDLCTVADLSDRPLDRKAQGALTAMEDQWDIGAALVDPEHFWTGQVDAREFDPLVTRSSKVWRATRHGTPFLPISKDGEYVFVVGTSVFVRQVNMGSGFAGRGKFKVWRAHKDLPDLELAMAVAEDGAQERGGDLGKLLADKNRAWRKERPSEEMLARAYGLGLKSEVEKIMSVRAGGKAGKVSDLISVTLATRVLEPMVERIKEATK